MSILIESGNGQSGEPVQKQESKLQVTTEVSRIVPDLFVNHPQGNMLRYIGAELLLKHAGTIQYWDNGRLTGEQNKQFHNVVDHQVLAGLFTDTAAKLLGMSDADREFVTAEALIHDWDVIIQKIGFSNGQAIARDGYMFYDENALDNGQYFFAEKSKTGIKRATGCDFTTFDDWGIQEYLLRAADNSVDMPNGYQDIVDPHTVRFPTLIAKKPDLHADGLPLYNMGTWDKLKEITSAIEPKLLQGIQSRNSEFNRYQNPQDLYLLVRNQIFGNGIQQAQPTYQENMATMNVGTLYGYKPTNQLSEVF